VWQSSTARFNTLYKEQIIKAKNVHLYTYANAVDIKANESISSVQQVVVKNHAGKTHTVKAKHFILACCAIQNARILLASNAQAPQGLGNDHDIVGRYFMEHLEINSAELWLFKPFVTDLYSWEYGTTKPVAELAIAAQVQRDHKISNGTASLIPLRWGRNAKPRIETWQDEDPRKSEETMFKDMDVATQKSRTETQSGIDNAFELDIRIEQAPNPDSRVTLGLEKDALGVPRANLHWALTSHDKRSIRTIFQIIGQEFGKAGLGRVKLKEYLREADDSSWPDYTNAGWHHMGTTRMSDDPKTGVVDANCKVHGIENLYVAGSGCYTTAAAPNPTLTVVALSLRLSDHVKSKVAAG
jgi:choline dehydrogenase-like flavoprotein